MQCSQKVVAVKQKKARFVNDCSGQALAHSESGSAANYKDPPEPPLKPLSFPFFFSIGVIIWRTSVFLGIVLQCESVG